MALSSTEMHHTERRLDIYRPLQATKPTDNSISLFFCFLCLSRTASLAPIHSNAINDCYTQCPVSNLKDCTMNLGPPCIVPHVVVNWDEKTFSILVNGKPMTAFIDRVKPAHPLRDE
ncbi:hypothetical protein TNCV_4944221 [Trichonephila clavipes]|nr:hypothetical protein TNCV_4944221 [Trichonephila clavipes]